jgi:hypothetical protein
MGCRDISTGDDFYNNTFGLTCYSITFGDNCYNNIIGNSSFNNIIGNNFNTNRIGEDFKNNHILNGFRDNFIGNSFEDNTIASGFRVNIIPNNFNKNIIGYDFYSNNSIGDYFESNKIGNYFSNNINIGNNFTNNVINDNFSANDIGDDFSGWFIQNNFSGETVASSSQNYTVIETLSDGFVVSDKGKLKNTSVITESGDTLTVNGDLEVTGNTVVQSGLTASTFNISSTPNTNTTDNDVLVRNSSTGEIENRSIVSLINTNNTITVALTGSSSDFNSIKSAVESISGSSSANTYTVKVAGGVYNEDPFTIPTWVAVVGDSSVSTIIQANDSSQTLIHLSDQSAIFDCQVQGCTDTGVSAIVYSSSTTPQSSAISYVENVRFGSNYTNAKVVAYGGANIIMQCSNVKYGGYPFTIGFYATNSGSGIGRMQLRNVTSTNGGITTTPGLIFAKADAQSCGFIVNGCLLTKSQGAAAGTGFYVENGGFLRLTAVNFQRWSVGIDAPQIGSAPSIDAIALNFENNTIDVNIAHSGATGKIQGTDNFLKTLININAPLYEVNQDPREILVAKKGGDFSTIKEAVDYLIASATTSTNSRYVISVGPGVFTEPEIDLTQTPYVSIVGSNIQTTQIVPKNSSQHIIKIGQNNEISFLSFSGAGSGYAAVYAYDIGNFGQLHKISIYDCDTGVWVESDTQDTILYGEYVDMNGEFTYGTKVIANNGYLALANMENYYSFPTGSGVQTSNFVNGLGATINIASATLESNGNSGNTALLSQDGGFFNVSATDVTNYDYGLRLLNVGGNPSSFEINGTTFANNISWDISVEQVSATGVFLGIGDHTKIYTISDNIYWSLLDSNDGELDITRKASVTFTDGSHTDFTTLIFEGGSMGLLSGGTLITVSGTTVQADGGFGYVEKSDNSGIVRRIDWSNTQITLSANSDNYIFINENGNLSSSGSRPTSYYNIILGRVVTNATGVEFIDLSPFNAEHTSNRFGNLFREALGPIYAFGSIVTEGTTPFTLDVTAGEYYYSTSEILPVGGTGLTFTQYYRNGTGTTWVTSATTTVNNMQWDNGGTLTGLTAGYYTKHTLYVLGDGTYENYFLVLGQNQYSTLVEVEDALLPTPPTYFTDSVAQIASIYIQQGATGITEVEDIRPTIAFRAGGVNASSVHGNLLGLNADDHTQYLLVSGTRPMSGNLNMGNNNIVSAGTINNVTIESHATRHQFGGADPIGTTTPSPNVIPYSDVSGTLDSWISTASTSNLGLVKVSTSPVLASNPIVVGENDQRFLKSFTGGSYSDITKTLTLITVDNTNYPISGFVDTYVTGFTYSDNTFTIKQNGKPDLTQVINSVTGWTVNGVLSATTISGGTYYGDGSNLTNIVKTITASTGLSADTSTGNVTLINTAPDQIITLSADTGISTSGTYPNFSIKNTAPDQTVVLNNGTGISTSGTYPNFTITNTAPDQTVTLNNGTGISTTGTYPTFTITNTAPDQTVSISGGTGITTGGTYPNFTIVNSLPDQTVVLNNGTGISTSGTYPNFTITNTSPDQTVTISGGTGITTGGTYPNFTITNSSPDQTVVVSAGSGISVSGTYPNFTITYTGTSGGAGSSIFTASTTTTNATISTVQTITGITDNNTSIIEVYVKAYQSSATNWGVWKRTLSVTKVSGTVTIQEENADVDKQSSGLSANSLSFSVSGGDILVQVTGIAATTINWASAYDIVI